MSIEKALNSIWTSYTHIQFTLTPLFTLWGNFKPFLSRKTSTDMEDKKPLQREALDT